MTLQQAKTIAKTKGFTLRHRDGEYRVNLIGGTEQTAYYTDDRQDAVDTGSVMALSKLVTDMRTAVDATVKAFCEADDANFLSSMKFIRHQLDGMLAPIAATTPIDPEYDHPGEILYHEVRQHLRGMDLIIRLREMREVR